MKINTSLEANQTAILALEGAFDQKEAFTDLLKHLLTQGSRHFVIDLSKAHMMDAADLGKLIGAWKTIHGAGGDMRLACISGRVRRMLQVTRLDSILKAYDTPAQAMDSFPKPDAAQWEAGREAERVAPRACA